MPKGKKFTAAEKHFIEKEQRYQRQIKRLNEYIAAQDLEIARLKVAVNERDKEILLQTDWINRLLEYTELDREDIKTVCEADKRRNVFRQPYREGDTVFYIIKDTKVTVILRAKVSKILGETAQLDTDDQGSFFVTPDDYYFSVFPTRVLAERYLRGEFECTLED